MNRTTLVLTKLAVVTGVMAMMCDGMWHGHFSDYGNGEGYKNIPHKAKNRYGNRKRAKRR